MLEHEIRYILENKGGGAYVKRNDENYYAKALEVGNVMWYVFAFSEKIEISRRHNVIDTYQL